MLKNSIIYGLSSSKELTEEICKRLQIKQGEVEISKFADGEILTQNKTSVRGKEVFIIQSTSKPVNDNLMELLIFIDSLKRGSAKEITVIIPYYGYSRQDRKAKGRQPISAKLVADLLEVAGVHRIITFEIHSPQIQGFFNIPVDNIKTSYVFFTELYKRKMKDLAIVSPDHGGISRTRELATFLDAPIVIIDKRRPRANECKVMNVLGEVKGKNCIVVDDMIDTGGTISNAAIALKQRGAKSVMIVATHAIFSGKAAENLNIPEIDEIIVTNSIVNNKSKDFKRLTVLSLGDLISEIIISQSTNRSISDIYELFHKDVVSKINK